MHLVLDQNLCASARVYLFYYTDITSTLPGPFANRQRGNGVADDTIRLPGSYSKKTNEYDHMQDNWRIILRHLSAFRIVKEHSHRRYADGLVTSYRQLATNRLHPVACDLILVEPGGIEPPTPCLQSRCSPS